MPKTVLAKTPAMGLDGHSEEVKREKETRSQRRTNIVWKVADGVEL